MLKPSLLALVALSLSGCAVTQSDVKEFKNIKANDIDVHMHDAKAKAKQESGITILSANYLGDAPLDLPYASQLPQQFFEPISLRSNVSFGSVEQAARNITLATGIQVRVNADVSGLKADASAKNVSQPMPSPLRATPNAAGDGTETSLEAQNIEVKNGMVRLDYKGTLLGYVKDIAGASGVEWEYADNSIYFYRLITKNFSIPNLSPGEMDLADTMSKGGQANTGQVGGANATSTGSFGSTASVGIKANYSIWKQLKTTLESTLSPQGKLSVNEGVGTITVTDTKDAVKRVEKLIAEESATLGRQVMINVRVIRIDTSKASQAGLDVNAVLSSFNADGTLDRTFSTTAPGTLTSATASSVTFKVNNPLSPVGGSTISAQALNQFGTVVSDTTSTVITTNRVSAMTGSFKTQGFLASTTPAAGGGVSGGAGVPGLTPGSVTVGSFLRVLPTIRENNTILLNMSIDISDLLGLDSASTGTGATMQQIQWANTSGTKTISNMLLTQDESMVMVGVGSNAMTSKNTNGITGASVTGGDTRTMLVVIVTPRVMKGL